MKNGKKEIVLIIVFALCGLLYLQANTPEWQWVEQGSGESYNQAYDIVVDNYGYVYVTGSFSGLVTFGETEMMSYGSKDIIVAKLDSDGNWIWIRQAGGNHYMDSYGIDIDAEGNIYITGSFVGTADFGEIELSSDSRTKDLFVAKLTNDGTWIWAIQSVANDPDHQAEGRGIAVDDNGNCYIAGFFSTATLLGETQLISSGREDTFVAKIDSEGEWLWVNKAAGERGVLAKSITLDNEGNGYISGDFVGQAEFDDIVIHGNEDERVRANMFIAKICADGEWVRVTGVVSDLSVYGNDIVADDEGNVYVAGLYFVSAEFGDTFLESNFSEAFMAKLSNDGEWEWAVDSQGGRGAGAYGIALDTDGNCYFTGHFYGLKDFGEHELQSLGLGDVFVAKTDNNGEWLWAKQAGGEHEFLGRTIAVYKTGNIYIAGEFRGSGHFGDMEVVGLGQTDTFVAKIRHDLQLNTAINIFPLDDAADVSVDLGSLRWDYLTQPSYLNPVGFRVYFSDNSNFDQDDQFDWVPYIDGQDSYSTGDILPEKLDYGVDYYWMVVPTTKEEGTGEGIDTKDCPIWTFTTDTETSADACPLSPVTKLIDNSPNPFNPETVIRFSLADEMLANLEIYNVKGQLIKTLHEGMVKSGVHSIFWGGKDNNNRPVGSGVYFYRLTVGDYTVTKRMILMK